MMRTSFRPRRRAGQASTLVAAILAAVWLLGCGASSETGIHHPPPSLDPASLTLVAEDTTFDQSALSVSAGRPFVLVFQNRDDWSHNVSIYASTPGREKRFDGEIVDGPARVWYPIPALEPGTYVFACDLHSGMKGTITAT